MPHDILSERLHFFRLGHQLQHDITLLLLIHVIVLIIVHLLQQQAIPWCQGYTHLIVLQSVGNEGVVQFAPEDLDDHSDHLPDLIIEEALPLQREVNKLNGFGVLSTSDLKSLSVYVHEVLAVQLYHEPHGCHLVRPDVLGIVVVLLGTHEVLNKACALVFSSTESL